MKYITKHATARYLACLREKINENTPLLRLHKLLYLFDFFMRHDWGHNDFVDLRERAALEVKCLEQTVQEPSMVMLCKSTILSID